MDETQLTRWFGALCVMALAGMVVLIGGSWRLVPAVLRLLPLQGIWQMLCGRRNDGQMRQAAAYVVASGRQALYGARAVI